MSKMIKSKILFIFSENYFSRLTCLQVQYHVVFQRVQDIRTALRNSCGLHNSYTRKKIISYRIDELNASSTIVSSTIISYLLGDYHSVRKLENPRI
jgi:hypothetical protein